jgi:putative membrane-bound dehydrogenase-like protein
MPHARLLALVPAVLLLLSSALGRPLAGQDGLAPLEGVKAMQLPPGFSVQLVASEPELVQPVGYCIDDRARLWVLENVSYPDCPGQKVNRIHLFTDAAGDGKQWAHKVVFDHLPFATGIQIGFGGLWIGAPPNLLFLPLTGDAVGEPQVVLDGWGWEDTHETLNNFCWGPDGWLYGTHGVFTHSKVGAPGTPDDQRVPLNAAVWRYHPQSRKFERWCEGASNQWGIDWNDQGEAFFTACVIPHLYHAIQGARYQRQGGEHFDKFTFADIKTIAQFGYDRAAYCGATIYLGGLFPAEYRNTLFFNDIHMSKVRNEALTRQGSGYVDSKRAEFLDAHDSWFRTLSLQYGPDGSLFLNDWFDKVHCHQQKAETDRTNGRIYKITYQGVKAVTVDLATASDEQLVRAQLDPNEWYVRHARRLLQERGPNPAVHQGLAAILEANPDETRKLRALWALHVTHGLTETLLLTQLKSPLEYLRSWSITLLAEGGTASPAVLGEFARLAHEDPSPLVRLHLASALQRLPVGSRWAVAEALCAHEEDNQDHNLPLMYWYAIEPAVPADPARGLLLAQTSKIDVVREFIPRRLGTSTEESIRSTLAAVAAAPPDVQRTLLAGITQTLLGRRRVNQPSDWAALSAAIKDSANPKVRFYVRYLSALFGDAAAVQALRATLNDHAAELSERRSALRALVHVRADGLAGDLQKLLGDSAVRALALRTLGECNDAATPAAIIAAYPSLNMVERRDALNTLALRLDYAKALAGAVDAMTIPGTDLTAAVMRQLLLYQDETLNALVQKIGGGPEKNYQGEVARLKQAFPAALIAKGDRAHGRALFERTCVQCHTLFGTGGNIGPDLTGLNRPDLDWVLQNVVDPSAVMGIEQQLVVVKGKDGRLISGIQREDASDFLTVQNESTMISVPRDEIANIKRTGKSTMPDGLLRPFSANEMRDFLAYFMGPTQVAGPGAP